MQTIREVLENVSKMEFSNRQYYNFLSLNTILTSMKNEEIEKEDMILTPYYICEKGILEIYDYELTVNIVETKSSKNYFLKKTGKKELIEIDRCILKKLQACYFELVKENLDVNLVLGYMEFVLESKELKERIEKIDSLFNTKKLFFELY